MAHIRAGSIVSDIRGKVGTEIYSRNRSGAYVKAYTSPVQPGSSSQLSAQAEFANGMAEWASLSNEERMKWIEFAANFKSPVGFAYKPKNGRDLFLSCYMKLNYTLGLSLVPQPSYARATVDYNMEILISSGSPGYMEFFLSVASKSLDYGVVAYVSDIKNRTVMSPNSCPTRYVYGVNSFDNNAVPIYSDWSSVWGASNFSSNQKVYWRMDIIDKLSGLISDYRFGFAVA